MSPEGVPAALRDMRVDAGLTQRKLARILGHVGNSHVCEMESGLVPNPRLETLDRWADACGYVMSIDFRKRS